MIAPARSLLLCLCALTLTACAPQARKPASGSQGPAAISTVEPSSEIRDAQQRLQALGLYHADVDGMWGPDSQIAVERFQRNRGLPRTAVLDPKTVAELRAETPPERVAGIARPVRITDADDVRAIQSRLRALTFYMGEVDGVWGPRTQAALERFQKSHGLPVGKVTGQTISALGLEADAFQMSAAR